MLGPVILAASRSEQMRRIVSAAPMTKPVVTRFIAGESAAETLPVVKDAADRGLEVTLDVLGEDITDPAEAMRARDAYLALVDALRPLIDEGRIKLYAVDSFDHLSWSNYALPTEQRAERRIDGRRGRKAVGEFACPLRVDIRDGDELDAGRQVGDRLRVGLCNGPRSDDRRAARPGCGIRHFSLLEVSMQALTLE